LDAAHEADKVLLVGDAMTRKVFTAKEHQSINDVSNLIIEYSVDQIPIVDNNDKLVGIVTSWDITKAVATKKAKLHDVMTTNVITSKKNESLDLVSRRLEKYAINSTPVVDDENNIIGIITSSDINKAYRTQRTRK